MRRPMPPGMLVNAAPVWVEGYSGRLRGVERCGNPYVNRNDFREDAWDDGWLYADSEIARRGLPSLSKTPARDRSSAKGFADLA